MARAASHPTDSRISARIPSNLRERLKYAAALAGAPLSQFMVQASLKEAEAVIERNQSAHRIVLTANDYQRMWDLVDHPPAPNQALYAALNRYQESFSVLN